MQYLQRPGIQPPASSADSSGSGGGLPAPGGDALDGGGGGAHARMADIAAYGDALLTSHVDADGGISETLTVQQRGWDFWNRLAEGEDGGDTEMAGAALSMQGRQREVLRKMIQHSSEDGAADQGWKVLVLDKYCMDIVSPLFKVGDLQQLNVTLFMRLHEQREPIPDVPAIYFVQPTADNIERICQDVQAELYHSVHLNLSSELSRSLMEKLASGIASGQATNCIDRVYDQYTNFVSLEPGLFSLAERDVFPILNDPAVKDTAIMECLDRVVGGLFSACVTLGTLPVIRCGRGGPAEMVAQKLDAKLRDHLQSRNNLFADSLSGRGAVGSRSRPVLLILERGNDIPIMLQHNKIYQSQVHDLLAMKNNCVSVEATDAGPGKKNTHDLDVNEPFFGENARLEFPRVAENIEQGLERYKQRVEEVNAKTAGTNTNDAEVAAASTLTAELSAAIAELPKLKENKRVLDMHTEIAGLLLKQVQQRNLNEYWDLQDDILSGRNDDLGKRVLTLMQSPAGTPEDKLRLLLICFWVCDSFSDTELGDCVSALQSAGGQEHALNFLRTLKQQVKALTRKDSLASAPRSSDSGRSLINSLNTATSSAFREASSMASMVKDSIGLESEHLCEAAMTTEAVMANRHSAADDPMIYLDPNPRTGARVGGGVARQQKAFTDAIVFTIGGGNYLEYEHVMRLSTGERNIIYGATDIVSPREFLAQLEELGKRSR